MFDWLTNAYNKFWGFFKNSGIILAGWISSLIGILTIAFTSVDWSVLYALFSDPAGFTFKQAMSIGAFLLAQGIALVYIRKSNTKEVDGMLIPKSTEVVATKAVKKPGKLKKVPQA